MKKVILPTNGFVKGPWLLDEKALKELDQIISEQWAKLEKTRKNLLNDEIENEYVIQKISQLPQEEQKKWRPAYGKSNQYSKSARLLSIYCSDTYKHLYTRFEDALHDSSIVKKVPIGFFIEMQSGVVHCNFSLEKKGTLEIDVSPEDSREAQELFTVLHNWAEKHRAKSVPSIVSRIAEYRFVILALFAISMYLIVVNNAVSTLENQLKNLFLLGITNANVVEVAKLLTQIQTHSFVLQLPVWIWQMFFELCYISVLLFVQPKAVLAIGKGIKSIEHWKLWFGIMFLPLAQILVPSDVLKGLFELLQQIWSLR